MSVADTRTTMQGLLTDAPRVSLYELGLAKQMAEALHGAYPGHLWGVCVSERTGMADIRNLALSGQWGYRLKLKDHYSASEWRAEVIRAGGEILERFRVARGKATDAINALPVDVAGRPIFDRS